MNKRKLLLTGMGIFLAGVLVGGAGMGVFDKERSPMVRMNKVGPTGFFMERLDYILKLRPEQKEAMMPIIEDVMARVREAREPCMKTEEDAFNSGVERINAVLDPVQKEKFTDFMEKAKERRKRFFGH